MFHNIRCAFFVSVVGARADIICVWRYFRLALSDTRRFRLHVCLPGQRTNPLSREGAGRAVGCIGSTVVTI
jgi:hypothetical protein